MSRNIRDVDRELATVLAGLSIRPGTHLLGLSLQKLVAYLLGYSRAQRTLGRPTILDGSLLSDFGEWLGREKGLVGSDWYWKVEKYDQSDRNAETMFALVKEYLISIDCAVPESDAADWHHERGRWGPGGQRQPH